MVLNDVAQRGPVTCGPRRTTDQFGTRVVDQKLRGCASRRPLTTLSE